MFKKIFRKIKEWFVWFSSKRVLEAINGDATYEEVKQIAKSLILDKTVLDDAEQYYNYIVYRYGKEEE